jgi:hypothetical protein
MDLIKDPVDLTLIAHRLESKHYYWGLEMFVADLRRMLNNCRRVAGRAGGRGCGGRAGRLGWRGDACALGAPAGRGRLRACAGVVLANLRAAGCPNRLDACVGCRYYNHSETEYFKAANRLDAFVEDYLSSHLVRDAR